jgi:phosphoglycolate phosphatase-like HAD superfamily hydrolase
MKKDKIENTAVKKIFNNPQTKVIIFDFDGTLYFPEAWLNLDLPFGNAIEKYLGRNARDYILALSHGRHSTTGGLLKKHNIAFDEFCEFLKEEYVRHAKFDSSAVSYIWNKEHLQKLAKTHKLYIVTGNYVHFVEQLLDDYKLPKNIFTRIISVKRDTLLGKTKGDTYAQIGKENNLKPNEMLVIGNEYRFDLEPAELLGIPTLLITADNCKEFLVKIN